MIILNSQKLLKSILLATLISVGSYTLPIHAMQEEDLEKREDIIIDKGSQEEGLFLLNKIHSELSHKDVLGVDKYKLAKLSNLSVLTSGCKNNETEHKPIRDNIRNVFKKLKTGTKITKEDIEALKELKMAIEADKPLCIFYKRYAGYYPGPFPESFKKDEVLEGLNKLISMKDDVGEDLRIEDLVSLNDLPLLRANLREKGTLGGFTEKTSLLNARLESFPLANLAPYNLPNVYSEFSMLFNKVKNTPLSERDYLKIIEHTGYLDEAIRKYNPSMQGKIKSIKKGLLPQYIKDTLHNIQEVRQLALSLLIHDPRPLIKSLTIRQQVNFEKIAALLSKDEIWVLSLDGGGIKGILGATVLDDMSKKLETNIPNLFDFFAGTSTGGLIALGLTAPSKGDPRVPAFNTEFVKDLYLKHGTTIFPTMSTGYKTAFQAWSYAYDPTPLEGLLKSFFANEMMSDLVKPTLVTTVNITQGAPMFFASYKPYSLKMSRMEEPTIAFNPDKNALIATAARATSAAPTYFPPITTFYNGASRELIDGGVTTNNPTLLALQEIYELKKQYPQIDFNIKRINVVSIGTGVPRYKHEFGRSGLGLLNVLQAFTEVGMGFSVMQTDVQVENFLNLLTTTGVLAGYSYYRFNPDVGDVELDSASVENVKMLSDIAGGIIKSPQYTQLLEHLSSPEKGRKEGSFIVRLLGNVKDPQNSTQIDLLRSMHKMEDEGSLGDSSELPPKKKNNIIIEEK